MRPPFPVFRGLLVLALLLPVCYSSGQGIGQPEPVAPGAEATYYWGMYFGILFIFFFFNLFLYIALKDISFLYYALLIFFHAHFEVYRTHDFGFYAGKMLSWSRYIPGIGFPYMFFLPGMAIFYLLFARSFLEIKQKMPRFNTIIIGLIIFFALAIIIAQLNMPIKHLCTDVVLLSYIFCFVVGVLSWRQGHKQARFFVFASATLTVSLLLMLLHELRLAELNFFIGNFRFDHVGFIMFLALLSFALGDRINILKKEKETALENALLVLEEKVQERTEEVVKQKEIIEEKNKDIMGSIRYAKRIQQSLLPTVKYIEKSLERLKKS